VCSSPASLQAFLDAPIAALATPSVVQVEVERPTLVLGSTQARESVDDARLTSTGTALVRRRSGGGAVLLVPGEATWLEVVVGRDHRRWDDDVSRSFHWLGDVFGEVLTAAGETAVEVHRGALVRSPWSDVACLAGLGSGEVTVAGKKVVGLSQRRTRAGARFQCVVVGRVQPEALAGLLRLEGSERAALVDHLHAAVAGVPGLDPATLAAEVARAVASPA
jgi:lipoate-protein ligase A